MLNKYIIKLNSCSVQAVVASAMGKCSSYQLGCLSGRVLSSNPVRPASAPRLVVPEAVVYVVLVCGMVHIKHHLLLIEE